MRDERGMTLVEVLVSGALLAIVAILAWQLMNFGLRASTRDQGDLLGLAAQRSAIDRICADARSASSVTAQDGGASLRITLSDGSVTYSTNAAGDLVRSQAGAEATVVRGVGSVAFVVELRPKPGGGNWQLVSINTRSLTGQTLTARVTVRRP
ncbi:MAG: type II secretion system protein J [Chloroflexota bacterium]